MKKIILTPQIVSLDILSELEQLKLIRLFEHPQVTQNLPQGKNKVEPIYISNSDFGGHKLISVGLNSNTIRLNSHPDNEEFLLFNTAAEISKKLYLLICKCKHNELQKKIETNELTALDFLLLQMVFNHPQLSLFTMLAFTPHCEITEPIDKPNPCFFVTEPAKLPQNFIDYNDYEFEINF